MPTATSLPLPNLDDRRWNDLVEEGRALIPFYAPGWTDHNIHDPGITLIELFAWLAEMDLFELNQITDAHRRKFLALAGITPAGPRPARSLLALALAGPNRLALDAGLEFVGDDPYGDATPFRSTHALTVVPGELAALLSANGGTFQNLTNAWKRGEPIQPFGADPGPGSAFYFGFKLDAPWQAGWTVSLGFALADPGFDLVAGAAERARITQEAADAARDCEPIRDTGCCPPLAPVNDPGQETDPPVDATLAHHDVRLVWEMLAGANRWARLRPGMDVWDGTRALSLPGRAALTLPEETFADRLGGVTEPYAWIRVRIARGRHDAAPALRAIALNAVEVEQAVPAITTFRIAPGVPVPADPGPVGKLIDLDLEINPLGLVTRLALTPAAPDCPAVRLLAYSAAARTLTLEAAALAAGTGGPSQELTALTPPLVAESVRVASHEVGGGRAWEVRPDFDASKRADAHVVVDAVNGVITFGDGERGRTPPAGSLLLATGDVTRAQSGDLAAGKIDRIADSPRNRALFADLLAVVPPVNVCNVVPASGGAAAETVNAAIARAREDRERAYRAVTLDDHIALAKETPGARLARAEARANFHPGFPCLTAPGIVTVLILPSLPADRPEPTAGLRWLVASYLNRRRVIGTRVEVAGPVYVPVRVRARVDARPGWRAGELEPAIADALDRFFDPLRGGPDGTGWPFGRDVYRSEVLQLIDEVPGVAQVRSLELIKGDDPPSCGNLCLGPTGLVDAGMHEITVVTGNVK